MIALDTNVLVRVVTEDDPEQTAAAVEILRRADQLWVSKTVLLETAWVLSFAYDLERDIVLDTLARIAGFENLVLEDRTTVARALAWARAGMDLADALHLASSGAASELVTFDRALVSKAKATGASPPVRLTGRKKRGAK